MEALLVGQRSWRRNPVAGNRWRGGGRLGPASPERNVPKVRWTAGAREGNAAGPGAPGLLLSQQAGDRRGGWQAIERLVEAVHGSGHPSERLRRRRILEAMAQAGGQFQPSSGAAWWSARSGGCPAASSSEPSWGSRSRPFGQGHQDPGLRPLPAPGTACHAAPRSPIGRQQRRRGPERRDAGQPGQETASLAGQGIRLQSPQRLLDPRRRARPPLAVHGADPNDQSREPCSWPSRWCAG